MKSSKDVLLDNKYSKLKGYDLFVEYAKTEHGITDEEISYLVSWNCLTGADRVVWPNDKRIFDDLCSWIVEYRTITLDEIRDSWKTGLRLVWEWPTAKRFYKIEKGQWHHDSYFLVGGPSNIVFCKYKDTKYYWGINKPEIEVTEDMVENGEWYVYTWAD